MKYEWCFFSLNLPLQLTVITSQLDYSDRKGKEEKCRVLHRTGMTRSHRHLDYSLFDLHLTLDRQPDSSKLAVLLITEYRTCIVYISTDVLY